MANIKPAQQIITELKAIADPERAKHSQRFFKTAPGEYGHGDKFLGVRVPDQRKIAKAHTSDLTLNDIQTLLDNPYHEVRLTGVIALTLLYKKASSKRNPNPALQQQIVKFYLKNTDRINNWDLVDTSAHKILGKYLLDKPREHHHILHELANSKSLWERRIAMIATATFIANNQLDQTYTLAIALLNDPEDLIHKAVGWMLREAGAKDPARLEEFLETHAPEMPRTMLSYATEKLTKPKQNHYRNLK